MLNINALSYWERSTFFSDVDFTIVGSGIVGASTAIHLKKKFPQSKVLLLERGYLPMGASTKNAGFACFGSVSELVDDLKNMSENDVWSTVQKRYEGLVYLKELVGEKVMDFQQNGSWDLISISDERKDYTEELPYLNENLRKITGFSNVYSEDKNAVNKFGFDGILTTYKNELEGQIDTGKLMIKLQKLFVELNVLCLTGIEVKSIEQQGVGGVLIQTTIGEIKSKNACVCVNGFAQQFLSDEDVLPARAQVLITKPIKDLKIKGTFHYNKGYYYFRNIHDRILFGGGRNLDFEGETTSVFETTKRIQEDLITKLNTMILPNTPVEVDYSWSGIMGVGKMKRPIVKKVSNNLAVGVRMGGMGVAIGSLVGKEVSDLF